MLANRSIPNCTVIPEIPYPDLNAAATWLSEVFDFTMRLRIANHRAQMTVGDGAVVLTEAHGDGWPRCSVMVRVEDLDQHYARASQRGARILSQPASHPYGERQYKVEDLAGHRWTFSQSIADVAPEEWGGTTGVL